MMDGVGMGSRRRRRGKCKKGQRTVITSYCCGSFHFDTPCATWKIQYVGSERVEAEPIWQFASNHRSRCDLKSAPLSATGTARFLSHSLHIQSQLVFSFPSPPISSLCHFRTLQLGLAIATNQKKRRIRDLGRTFFSSFSLRERKTIQLEEKCVIYNYSVSNPVRSARRRSPARFKLL